MARKPMQAPGMRSRKFSRRQTLSLGQNAKKYLRSSFFSSRGKLYERRGALKTESTSTCVGAANFVQQYCLPLQHADARTSMGGHVPRLGRSYYDAFWRLAKPGR